jgi:hypothetical protein
MRKKGQLTVFSTYNSTNRYDINVKISYFQGIKYDNNVRILLEKDQVFGIGFISKN